MARNSKFAGFTLTFDDIEKLRALSERYDGNVSMTVRLLIRDAYSSLENNGD